MHALRAALCAALLISLSTAAQVPIPENPGWTPVADEVFLQEVSERIETPYPLTAVAHAGGRTFAAGNGTVYEVRGLSLAPMTGPSGDIAKLAAIDGVLWAAGERGLWRLDGTAWTAVSAEPFVDVAGHLGGVIAATAGTVHAVEAGGLTSIIESREPILGAASYSESVYLLTAGGVAFLDNRGALDYESVSDWGNLQLGADVRSLASLGNRLAVATNEGVGILRGASWHPLTGAQGLPYEDVLCVAPGFAGDFWVGTRKGAARFVDGAFHYFGYDRWLPNEKVNAIAAGDHAVYLATDGGLGVIRYEPWTLQKKAAHYKQYMTDMGMRRMEFVHILTRNADGTYTRHLGDNDVSFSCHLLNGLCFEYAVTKDPAVREEAVELFKTVKWSEEITPLPGYPARAIHAVGEQAGLAETGSAGRPSEWNPTDDGKWVWKGDTSSDEVVAHYYTVSLFHDLVAKDGIEKDKAIEHLQRLTDHIIDNGWCLRDLDGKPTVWAQWSPDFIYHPARTDERGLNSLEALSFMAVANALFPSAKYADGKNQLIEWGYVDNILRQKITFPHYTRFDDRLAFLSYYPLLRYETDPAIRAAAMRSLQRSWEIKRIEKQTWFNFIYGALTGNECEAENAVEHLRLYPLDTINYVYQNSHRDDLANPPGYRNYLEEWKPFTPRDVGWQRWNRSFQQLDGGGGHGIQDPSGWLDAYWMGRYYGMIAAPTTKDKDLLTVKPNPDLKGAAPYEGQPRPDIF